MAKDIAIASVIIEPQLISCWNKDWSQPQQKKKSFLIDLEVSKDDVHNNVKVDVVEKGEYDCQKDTNVASIAYLLKPLEDASR